ncbi:MAG: hypothetical protein WBD30_14350 [Bacteroidota bacterium]
MLENEELHASFLVADRAGYTSLRSAPRRGSDSNEILGLVLHADAGSGRFPDYSQASRT